MKIVIADAEIDFRPWTPGTGQVFEKTYAFDSETTVIDQERPWLTPAYVLGAACDGKQGYFLTRDRAAGFFAAHANVPVVMHAAPFDLDVIHTLAPDLNIYRRVDADLV